LKKGKCEKTTLLRKGITIQIPSERRQDGQTQKPANQETANYTVVEPYILKISVKSE
jgi:hypothetical protein